MIEEELDYRVEYEKLEKKYEELQDRIDKAIKHCKSNMFVDSQFMEEQLEILGYKEDIELLGDIEEE